MSKNQKTSIGILVSVFLGVSMGLLAFSVLVIRRDSEKDFARGYSECYFDSHARWNKYTVENVDAEVFHKMWKMNQDAGL